MTPREKYEHFKSLNVLDVAFDTWLSTTVFTLDVSKYRGKELVLPPICTRLYLVGGDYSQPMFLDGELDRLERIELLRGKFGESIDDISTQYSHVKHLAVEGTGGTAPLKLPYLPNIESLKIRTSMPIDLNGCDFPKLRNLDLYSKGDVELAESMPELESLAITTNGRIFYPSSLPRLTTVEIVSRADNPIIPTYPTIEEMMLTGAFTRREIEGVYLPNLQDLTITLMGIGQDIVIPEFESLAILDIFHQRGELGNIIIGSQPNLEFLNLNFHHGNIASISHQMPMLTELYVHYHGGKEKVDFGIDSQNLIYVEIRCECPIVFDTSSTVLKKLTLISPKIESFSIHNKQPKLQEIYLDGLYQADLKLPYAPELYGISIRSDVIKMVVIDRESYELRYLEVTGDKLEGLILPGYTNNLKSLRVPPSVIKQSKSEK